MPYALVIIGLLMIITGINNTYSQFASQLSKDFSGSKSFIVWVMALGSVGALGYIKDLRQFSHYFMALILISMILANKGVFGQLQAALKSGPTAPTANADTSGTSGTSTGNSSGTNRLYVSPNSSTNAAQAGSVVGGATNSVTQGNDGGLFGSFTSSLTQFLLNPSGQ
jgi:hypothetical protein